MSLYVAPLYGALDMRPINGPFRTKKSAYHNALKCELEDGGDGFPEEQNKSRVHDWFSVHPAGGFVDGPYPSRRIAEFERQHTLSDEQSLAIDAGGDEGFLCVLIGMIGDFGILRRQDAYL